MPKPDSSVKEAKRAKELMVLSERSGMLMAWLGFWEWPCVHLSKARTHEDFYRARV
jgi:hypothetical protein